MQEKRLNEIQNYLKNHEICTYEELREYCDVSLSTIKRDIDFLDAEGRLLRIRGGARRLPSDPSSLAQEQQPIEMRPVRQDFYIFIRDQMGHRRAPAHRRLLEEHAVAHHAIAEGNGPGEQGFKFPQKVLRILGKVLVGGQEAQL